MPDSKHLKWVDDYSTDAESPSAAPDKAVVDDVRLLKRRNQRVICAVNVTNRNDSLDTGEMPLIGQCR